MTHAGISGAAVAFPSLRLASAELAKAWGATSRDVERRAIPAFDEDEATLAVAAARKALAASGRRADEIGLVLFATAGPAASAETVSEALGAGWARAVNVTGSATSGLAALVTAFDTVAAARNVALVVAADVPRAPLADAGELVQGAGAAAFVVSPGGAVRLAAAGAASADLPGARVVTRSGAVRAAEVDLPDAPILARALDASVNPSIAEAVDFLARYPHDLRVPRADGKPLEGARSVASLRAKVGECGAASVLVDLVAALAGATPGSHGLAVAREGGSALAARFAVEAAPAVAPGLVEEASRGREVTYVRALAERRVTLPAADVPDEPMGAYVSFPDFARSLPARYRLEGAACGACGRVAFPPRPTCAACGGASFKTVALSGRGRIYTFTVIGRGGAPSEFAAEQALTGEYATAIVELEEGPRVAARLADVADPAALSIGQPVEAVLRRLYAQQGVVRYGFKFRLAG